MNYQQIFKRYELKYMLTEEKKLRLLKDIAPYTHPDKYGASTVRNIYFDTDSYALIRHSIEKPVYKEKLRLRSYFRASKEDDIFVELKKKYKGVVYKRRIAMPESDALAWLGGAGSVREASQISREIEYFRDFYKTLAPKLFLSYEREAYYANDDSELRITFDKNILCRRGALSLTEDISGLSVLDGDFTLMEIKSASSIPLWLCKILSDGQIYKTSFSKYGEAYKKYIFKTETEQKTNGITV